MRNTVPVVVVLALVAGPARAQEVPEPPALEIPVGSRVRLQTRVAPDSWLEGVLVTADTRSISLVPKGAPPLGDNQLRLPSEAVARLEVVTGRKRQWLPGLLIGAAAGVAMGFGMDVDPERCAFDDNDFCSRGGAVAAIGGTFAGIGAVVGAFITKDVWTPVALDALGPPPGKEAWAGLRLRAVPGGVAVGLSVQF
jgi:hypothetical protein